ncbi:hypothetical protein N7462_008328 [Penicillium macrosclerotiorum]|uniref:uncharacterized protein n=1 Tax=Penicillium macrosclerotiorum TaxID=303699 RepID=UPI0025482203|nr:uncharacterized protein N7462_008328 [Penicillium macrosclerotiorum]KAJ5675431.1 hypothetical protein N7462_008328 [Penicillium macrosclerotiorum]
MAHPPLETFQIGWICALSIELAAAKAMLDENFGILDVQDSRDPNTYTLGRIDKHHIVIACLPAGQYGTTSATTVANNMVRTFSNSLRIGMMVGVGGGIPSAAHDIRLGDVVISCPEGTSGGVLQYDMGKVGTEGKFHRTGSLNSPPRALLTAINSMRADELTDDPRYPEYLFKAIGKTTRTQKNFKRPKEDRLFKPQHDHPTTASTCDGCLAEWEETRSQRETSDPQSHYGIIASGNAVIKDAYTREQLKLETGALCFEMEAAGLMIDFPCIVVRGICDYADTHKNKQWQGYAALAAASYAKELLGYIPTTHVSQENLVVNVCTGLKEEVEGTNKRLDRGYDQQEQHFKEQKLRALTDQHQRCHQAFKLSKYEEQKNINPRRVEGTCQWALQSAEYIRWWESNNNDLLWVSADPGCGKSVLARSIIDDNLRDSSSGVTICYFFFKDNEEQNHLATALCSLLHQLFSERPHLLPYALPSWEKNGEKIQHEVDELWRIFIKATSADSSHKTICVLDALDECQEADQGRLIEKLQIFYHHQTSSSTKSTSCLKFLVTSRPYDRIQDHFRAITDLFSHVRIKGEEENDRIHEEIDLVVKIRVKELAEGAQLPPEVYQGVEQQLLQMEHRTYLWLHLAMDDIRTSFKRSLRPAENSITLIPTSVDAAYEKILSRVQPDEMDIVKRILEIIVAARRPLTIPEMAVALGIATYTEARTILGARLAPTHLQSKLRQLCGLFVFINNSKIYLIHQTAREFLIQKQASENLQFTYWSSISDAEILMAEICLRYLLMEDLEDEEGKSHIRALLEYAAVHWADHVQKMSLMKDQEMLNQLHRVYDMHRRRVSLWFPIFWKAVMPYELQVPSMNALHLAAFNGHEQEVHFLIAIKKQDVNMADDAKTTPLMWASQNGHDRIVQILLERGADVNAQGGDYGTALCAASFCGYDQIVQILLEQGADVNAQGGDYGTALYAASCRGHDQIVQILLEQGADINAQGGDYGTALYAASFYGYDQIVQILLERGADVNAQGGDYGTALYAASCYGHDQIVQILLEQGADVNAEGGDYGTALCAASFCGYDQIVQILLERGADVNAEGGDYGTALYAASCYGYDQIVQILLERGAYINAQGGDYGTALCAASFCGYDQIVQILLEQGADVNAQGGDYGTALYAASCRGHDQIVQILLERGADVNAQGRRYGTALCAASSEGHDNIVQILLERGADVNAQGGRYGTALCAASSEGHDNIVQILLERGADVNAEGGRYGTALQIASSRGYDQIVQILLERGADVNAQGGFYGTALQIASSKGLDKIVQILLERGADVNAQGGFSGTALQIASSKGLDKIVQILLERGADVNAEGGFYGTALQIASSCGHDKIVQILLERGADGSA